MDSILIIKKRGMYCASLYSLGLKSKAKQLGSPFWGCLGPVNSLSSENHQTLKVVPEVLGIRYPSH
jgi:hypothetical protein